MWKYDVNGGDKIYSVNDVLAFYLDGNKNGFSYQVIGDFDKQQITDLGNTNGKDMISKILSTWENAIFIQIIGIYEFIIKRFLSEQR